MVGKTKPGRMPSRVSQVSYGESGVCTGTAIYLATSPHPKRHEKGMSGAECEAQVEACFMSVSILML